MMSLASLTGRVGLLLLVSAPVFATPPARPARGPVLSALPSAEQFVLACANQLTLSQEQRAGLREYLEQELNFLAVQRANHTAAEVAELLPAERQEFHQVTGRLMSPTQLRRFRELEATPRMQEYLRQMALAQ